MKPFTLQEVLNATGGNLKNGMGNQEVFGVSTDTRKIQSGDLFFALIGENTDGHLYIEKAYEKGCGGVVVSKEVPLQEGIAVIQVEDTLAALQQLAADYLKKFSLKKIAVTGSTGKTTTKEMLFLFLSTMGETAKNEGNFNNHIGLPLTVFTVEEKHQYVVFEMGMSGLGEIHLMTDIVRPDMAVITNIGVSHIERLGSQENILKAKMEVTDYFSTGNTLVINDDNDLLSQVEENVFYDVVRVGKKEHCKYQILEIKDEKENGITLTLKIDKREYSFKIMAPGIHNGYNCAVAVAVACEMGAEPLDLIEALPQFKPTDKRLMIKKGKKESLILDDTYNASPDSMKAALSVLNSYDESRRIAILGDMFELGEQSSEYHKEIGRLAGSENHMVLSVGKDAAYIHQGAREFLSADQAKYYGTKEELIGDLDVKKGDVILVKASRGMRMEEIVDFLQKE